MFFQDSQLPQVILNMKTSTIVAGLLGALITLLRKSEGSLQARLFGYITAIVTVIYLIPFVLWFIEWRFALTLHPTAENLLSFIFGMLAQKLTESFIDNPTTAVLGWTRNFYKVKRAIFNGESFLSEPPEKQNISITPDVLTPDVACEKEKE